VNAYDKEKVSDILAGHGDWFTAKLMRLIASADMSNREKLYLSYPEEVDCVRRFQTGGREWAGVENE
jgi:hypothetical protein